VLKRKFRAPRLSLPPLAHANGPRKRSNFAGSCDATNLDGPIDLCLVVVIFRPSPRKSRPGYQGEGIAFLLVFATRLRTAAVVDALV